MLEYKNITYKIGNATILDNVTFKLESNKITTILGPNGSGKSTIIKMLGINKNEYEGNIYFNNKEYNFQTSYSQISILKQFTNVPDHLTCQQFLELCYTTSYSLFYKLKIDDKNKIEQKVLLCDCTNIINKQIQSLSGGERQRILICAALLREPKVLILDEPTTFLDIKYQALMMRLIKKLNQEEQVTILLILHDINQAIEISHNILLIKEGEIIYKGLSDNLQEKDLHQCFDIDFKKHYKHFVAKI